MIRSWGFPWPLNWGGRLSRTLGAIIAGLILVLAFPGFNYGWLAIPALLLYALVLWQTTLPQAAWLGFVFCLSHMLPILHWTNIYVGNTPWIALCMAVSLFFVLTAMAMTASMRLPFWPVSYAALWVAQELGRGTQPFGGFPWAKIAFSQADTPYGLLARFVGAPGVTFAVAASSGILLWGILHLQNALLHRSSFRKALLSHLGEALVFATIIVAISGGMIAPINISGPHVQVLGVQGNVPTMGLDFNAQREAVLRNHVQATTAASHEVANGKLPQPDLVVWPENSVDIDPFVNAHAGEEIMAATRAIQAPIIVGAVLEGPGKYVSNSSLLYLPRQGFSQRYDKRHPVPFAEYIPFRSFFRFFSAQVDNVRRDFHQGQEVVVFSLNTAHGPVKVAPIICFEVAYDQEVREAVNAGGTLLAVQTNNATFGFTAESEQQLAISRIRALEHGRSIVHVSTVGVSGLILPDGRVIRSSKLFTRDLLSGSLPVSSQMTMARRLSFYPEVLCCVFGSITALAGWRRGRKGQENVTS